MGLLSEQDAEVESQYKHCRFLCNSNMFCVPINRRIVMRWRFEVDISCGTAGDPGAALNLYHSRKCKAGFHISLCEGVHRILFIISNDPWVCFILLRIICTDDLRQCLGLLQLPSRISKVSIIEIKIYSLRSVDEAGGNGKICRNLNTFDGRVNEYAAAACLYS
jgi:hypothetical protein